MKDEYILKILFEMVYDCFGIDLPMINDKSSSRNSYYAVLSQRSINIICLIDSIENRYGPLSQDFYLKYDLRKLDDAVKLLSELE